MASIQIPNLPAAIALTASDLIEIVQAGMSMRATLGQIPLPSSTVFTDVVNTFTQRQEIDAGSVNPALTIVQSGAGAALLIQNGSGTKLFVVAPNGAIALSGENYGASGQSLVSNGSAAAASWYGGYNDAGTNTAAQQLGTYSASKVTISADTTLTTTVPAAGLRATVLVFTSGTTTRTVTFGTGFKSQGTLATGATASRYWCVSFISDGTNLIETGRTTTAIA